MRYFENPDGFKSQFGAGSHLRTWKSEFGTAHELWVADDNTCFHSPGVGDSFGEESLDAVLGEVKWLFVINQASTREEFLDQYRRALAIQGLPWNLPTA